MSNPSPHAVPRALAPFVIAIFPSTSISSAASPYYALTAGSVEREEAPERMRKGLSRHPIPVILLARLAVDQREKGKGLGAALLKDALTRAAGAAEEIGGRAVLVHAKDEEARAFYEHFDFEPSPTDPLHLFLLMTDLARVTGGHRAGSENPRE